MLIDIYTDGGSRFNPGPGAWALLAYVNNKLIKQDCGFKESTTNNEMEVTAIKMALEYIPEFIRLLDTVDLKVRILTDSSYAMNSIDVWSNNWIKDGTIDSRPNGKLIKMANFALKIARTKVEVEFVKVKGHSGVKGNELADRLLNEVMDKNIDSHKTKNYIDNDVIIKGDFEIKADGKLYLEANGGVTVVNLTSEQFESLGIAKM